MSLQKIICPRCQAQISIDDVLTKQIETTVRQSLETEHQAALQAAKQAAIEQAHQAYLDKIQTTKAESELREKQNQELRQQVTELIQQLRQLKDKDEKRDIEFQKKLLDEQEVIKSKAKQEATEELSLQLAKKDKLVEDLTKQLAEAQRKAEQGSQQLQGEVQELQLEEILKREFLYDEIKEVPKGINGADVIQIVRTAHGSVCGTIVWESKNTKNWSPGWIGKLKADQRLLKAELAVLVSKVLPDHIGDFGFEEGVVLTGLKQVVGIAELLRQQLIKVKLTEQAQQGKAGKAEIVYNYLVGNDFKQRIEVWVEYFQARKEEIDKERLYFMKKWDKEEKNIFKIIQNTAGIYGDLQGLIGPALPKVQNLELPEGDDSETLP